MATTRSSTLYTNTYVNKYITDARDRGGRIVPIPFDHTVVSGETGGASAGVQDKVNLCVLPANCEVIGLEFSSNDLWASAGANGTLELGDSGDSDRYMVATELYTALASPSGAEIKQPSLAFAGMRYRPTVDTVVQATYKTANPVVGKRFKGAFLIVPGA